MPRSCGTPRRAARLPRRRRPSGATARALTLTLTLTLILTLTLTLARRRHPDPAHRPQAHRVRPGRQRPGRRAVHAAHGGERRRGVALLAPAQRDQGGLRLPCPNHDHDLTLTPTLALTRWARASYISLISLHLPISPYISLTRWARASMSRRPTRSQAKTTSSPPPPSARRCLSNPIPNPNPHPHPHPHPHPSSNLNPDPEQARRCLCGRSPPTSSTLSRATPARLRVRRTTGS